MKQYMVDLHNQARASVNPPAASMPTVVWDDSIAAFALNYSLTCQGTNLMNHNPNRVLSTGEYIGENLWGTTASLQGANVTSYIHGAASSWASESVYYTYSTNTCQSGQMCGHYTQMVWKNSVNIGCAIVYCSNLLFKTSVLCDYGPGGNYVGERPYVSA